MDPAQNGDTRASLILGKGGRSGAQDAAVYDLAMAWCHEKDTAYFLKGSVQALLKEWRQWVQVLIADTFPYTEWWQRSRSPSTTWWDYIIM